MIRGEICDIRFTIEGREAEGQTSNIQHPTSNAEHRMKAGKSLKRLTVVLPAGNTSLNRVLMREARACGRAAFLVNFRNEINLVSQSFACVCEP